jgi:uncharacterized protein
MQVYYRLAATLVLAGCNAVALGAAVPAGKDPTLDDIYRATHSGHIEQAKEMIGRVLKDHPDSAKAHYVAAEVYVRTCDRERARAEFKKAEALQPELKFASQRSVQALKSALRQPIPARCGVSV